MGKKLSYTFLKHTLYNGLYNVYIFNNVFSSIVMSQNSLMQMGKFYLIFWDTRKL